jgi:uncharacterized damage-inducible protein DinB
VQKFFVYNWQVRDEWFEWCHQLSHDELIKERTGGAGSFLHTLFHIVEVEYSWIRGIEGKEDRPFHFENFQTLADVQSLSNELRMDNTAFLHTNIMALKDKSVNVVWDEQSYTVEDILHHIIAHEIHHIGQLSIWAREIGLSPVPAHFIGRKL